MRLIETIDSFHRGCCCLWVGLLVIHHFSAQSISNNFLHGPLSLSVLFRGGDGFTVRCRRWLDIIALVRKHVGKKVLIRPCLCTIRARSKNTLGVLVTISMAKATELLIRNNDWYVAMSLCYYIAIVIECLLDLFCDGGKQVRWCHQVIVFV